MTGNLQNCQHLRPMNAAEAAQAMARLAGLDTQGQPLALGLWHGTLTGTESGNVYRGEYVSVFTDQTCSLPLAPRATKRARPAPRCWSWLRATRPPSRGWALPEDYKPGGLSELCQPTIDGYAAEKSGMDDDMVQHLVNLLGTATSSTTGEQHQAAWPVRPPAARAATWRPPRQSAGACRRRFQVHARENRRKNIQGREPSASQRFDRA